MVVDADMGMGIELGSYASLWDYDAKDDGGLDPGMACFVARVWNQ